MDKPEVTSQSVVEPIVTVIQGYGLEEALATKVTTILEKLGTELNELQYVPSPDLMSLVDDLMVAMDDEDWEEDDDDDFDDGIELEEEDDDEGEEDVL